MDGDVGRIIVKKEARIIESKFTNKKSKKEVKQCLVKIPKTIIDRLSITSKNKITFEIVEEFGKPKLKMELI